MTLSPTTASTTPAQAPAWPRPAQAARWLGRQLLILMVVAVGLSLLLVSTFGSSWTPTLIYSFLISLGCATFIQVFRVSAGWGRWKLYQRMGWPVQEPFYWPGWPLMVICLVCGTMLGYGGGAWVGNLITGLHFKGPFDAPGRALLGILGFSLLPGIALTFIFLWRGKAAAAEARAETLRRQAAETQLRLLESQLEPHMLFNTLANLRVLIGMDTARAQAMLDHLIAFLRATLAGSQAERHALRDEFARLADYLALMQVRMGQRLRFEFELPAEAAELLVPPLLLQPLVENAIKHGLEPHVAGGLLRVRATLSATDGLRLSVEDNGVGYAPAATPAPGSGFGTRQIRERLAVVYGAEATLQVQARPEGGTLATIHIPHPALSH
ncbi:Histidine kinase-, DNA gyrase B-, and HSP90-like ATPase [Roseateles sp. YR242]|uniref:sensor histidine kinase n=1 Tax=Roseateles sp. YR242 TaxID=1855305 RepID=UPI0008CB7708|nr:histidine kinase [Roseateles sp. YR242]SEK33691.1 Histidine kinase-, DNA gyrase B-, and HSP90-like ATPase [Roseateles sp. YR242]